MSLDFECLDTALSGNLQEMALPSAVDVPTHAVIPISLIHSPVGVSETLRKDVSAEGSSFR